MGRWDASPRATRNESFLEQVWGDLTFAGVAAKKETPHIPEPSPVLIQIQKGKLAHVSVHLMGSHRNAAV